MDEARRFLRYVIPGLLFITETVLFFRIIFKRWPTSELPPTSDIGLALGTALGAAAVGFMLSMGHYWLSWRGPSNRYGIDYREVIRRLQTRHMLVLLDAETPETPIDWASDRLQAWTIFTSLWWERVEDGAIKSANPRAESLASLVHSTGAARVGVVIAWVAVVAFAAVGGPLWSCRSIGMTALAFLFLCLHDNAYRTTARIAQRVTEQVLDDALTKEAPEHGPVSVHVSRRP